MKRKLLAGLLALSMVVSLASCGQSSDETVSGKDPSSGEKLGVGEGITIELWNAVWGSENYGPALEKIAEEATQANIGGKGIVVKTNTVAWDNYYDTYLTAATSGTGPDIAAQAGTAPIMYYTMEYGLDLMPLYEMWEEEDSTILKEIPQECFDYFTFDGALTAIPWGNDSQCLIANMDLLEAAGITELPTSWDEFDQVCATIQEKTPDKIPVAVACGSQAACTSVLNWFLHDFDSGVVNEDFKGNLRSENAMAALNTFKSFVDKKYIPEGTLGYASDEVQRLFLAEEAVFYQGGAPNWMVGSDIEPKCKTVAPLSSDVSKGYADRSLQGYYAMSGDHNEETMLVLKWWIENNYTEWEEGGNFVSPLRSSYYDKLYGGNDLMKCYAETNIKPETRSYVYPLSGMYPFHTPLDGEATAGAVLQEILAGTPVEEAAENCDKEMEEILEEYGY